MVYFGTTLIVYAEGKHNDDRFVFEGMRFTGGVVVSWWICVQLVATLVSGVVSRPEAPIIKLYDPTLETSSSPDVIEYTSEVGDVPVCFLSAGGVDPWQLVRTQFVYRTPGRRTTWPALSYRPGPFFLSCERTNQIRLP